MGFIAYFLFSYFIAPYFSPVILLQILLILSAFFLVFNTILVLFILKKVKYGIHWGPTLWKRLTLTKTGRYILIQGCFMGGLVSGWVIDNYIIRWLIW